MGVAEILLGIAFPLLIALGAGVAMTDASWGEFWFARGCFIAASLDALGFATYWLWPELGRPLLWRLSIAALFGAILLPILIFALHWVDVREDRTLRQLFPGTEPLPALAAKCKVPADALMVSFGSNLGWATNMPHTIIQMGGDPILSIDRDRASASLIITVLRIFDDRNDIIAKIDKDGFWVRGDTRMKRPDRSSLIVFDHNDSEVLNIRFLNPRAISVTGIFRHTHVRFPVILTPEYMEINTNKLIGNCMGEAKTDIVIQ